MSSTKINSLYRYLQFYGADVHACTPDSPTAEWPNKDNFYHWRELKRRKYDGRISAPMPAGCTPPEHHWPHLRDQNTDTPEGEAVQIGFYATVEHAIRDRRTFSTIGRYLTKYFSAALTPKEVADYATRFRGEHGTNMLQFAHTPEDIINVYRKGPNSCMSKALGEYETSIHPVAFYGNGITAIAYLTSRGKITARTVIVPEHKVYSVVYGDRAIIEKLKPLGYKAGSLTGVLAPITVLSTNERNNTVDLLLPFIDGVEAATYHHVNKTVKFEASPQNATPDTTHFRPKSTGGVARISIPTGHRITPPPPQLQCGCCGKALIQTDAYTVAADTNAPICDRCITDRAYAVYGNLRATQWYANRPQRNVWKLYPGERAYITEAAVVAAGYTKLSHKFDEHGIPLAARTSSTVNTVSGFQSLAEDCLTVRDTDNTSFFFNPTLEETDPTEDLYCRDSGQYDFRLIPNHHPVPQGFIRVRDNKALIHAIERGDHTNSALTELVRQYTQTNRAA